MELDQTCTLNLNYYPGKPWHECEDCRKKKEESNSFTYCPNNPENNEENPTYT